LSTKRNAVEIESKSKKKSHSQGPAPKKLTGSSSKVYDALKGGKLVLSIEIDDYEKLNCVKKFSDFFEASLTINEVLHQIAKKKSVFLDLSEGKDKKFQLYLQDKKEKRTLMDKEKSLSFYGLKQQDVLVLKQVTPT